MRRRDQANASTEPMRTKARSRAEDFLHDADAAREPAPLAEIGLHHAEYLGLQRLIERGVAREIFSRRKLELELQLSLMGSLLAVQSATSSELADCCARGLALCEELSFTRAAGRCGVAQPSLTRAIQLLEQEIGGRLFERGKTSVRLTELGARVHPDFVRINQSTENIGRTAACFLASSLDTSDQRPMEGFARALAIGTATISILAAGTPHPTPRATTLESAAGSEADPFDVQSGRAGQARPGQKTEDFF